MAVKVLIIIITVIIIGSLISFFILGRKRKAAQKIISFDLMQSISMNGLEIPILESFSGPKGLAPLAFGSNNLNPELVLYDDHFEYKTLFRKGAYYSDIESIRSYRSRYYNKLRFTFSNRLAYYTAVFGNAETMQTVLKFLEAKGIRTDEHSRM